MSEASEKQVIELRALVAEKALPPESVLDLLSEIARRNECHADLDLSNLVGASQFKKSPYPANVSRAHVAQALVYSCTTPAVLAILQTLQEMFA